MENESTRCGKTAREGSLFRRFLTCHREVLPFSQMLSTCSFTLRSSALSRFFGSEKRSICRHWSLATFPYVDLALHSHPSFFLSFLRFRLDRVVPTLTKSFKMLLRWVQRSFLSYWYNEARVDVVIELVSFPFQPIISSPKTWWLIRNAVEWFVMLFKFYHFDRKHFSYHIIIYYDSKIIFIKILDRYNFLLDNKSILINYLL